jgi:hypothetical protein
MLADGGTIGIASFFSYYPAVVQISAFFVISAAVGYSASVVG